MCVLLVFSQLFDTGEVVVRRLIEASDYVVRSLPAAVPSCHPYPHH